jgi:hypothetical protein
VFSVEGKYAHDFVQQSDDGASFDFEGLYASSTLRDIRVAKSRGELAECQALRSALFFDVRCR